MTCYANIKNISGGSIMDLQNKNGAEVQSTEEFSEEEIARGRRERLKWSDIEIHASCFPEHEERAHCLILDCLGYIPATGILIPHEVFIRSLVDRLRRSDISDEQFGEELELHCKQIRNDDMKKGGWVDKLIYTEHDYHCYETENIDFRSQARERLGRFLGYEPALEHCLDAELYLRETFTMDWFHSELEFTSPDYKAATIIKYRESLLLKGQEAADNSDLIGLQS